MPLSEVAKRYIGKTEKAVIWVSVISVSNKNDCRWLWEKQAWCSYFAELVAKESLASKLKELDNYSRLQR